jgi:hypothetical protein
VPGIGKKTAERLLLELKGKFGPTWVCASAEPVSASDAAADIQQALVALGYSDKEAALALKALPDGCGCERRHQARAEVTGEVNEHPDRRLCTAAGQPRGVGRAELAQRGGDRACPAAQAADEYVGQAKAREQLEIFIGAARKRGEALDHVLLFGPPGLGKTTLSHIIAHELGVNLRQTSGPVLEKPKDLAALLTNLEKNDVLFIDEIHRSRPVVEEILYPALEDYQIDIMIGEGPAARHQARPCSPSRWWAPPPAPAC